MGEAVHPHLFRHQILTFLTGQKLSDAQIQLLSGHASKKSLEVYQPLSLDAVDGAYQQAVKLLEVQLFLRLVPAPTLPLVTPSPG